MPYFLLHSLSHLLMTAVSLECGYPASSIRERVYALEAGYGILLYTGTPDAEGTLGGLVEAGRQIDRHLQAALELGRLCSNDPVCAQHDPQSQHERRFLHGAACHGCLLIAETSCEQHNDFLDRALVVPTVEDLGAEFFQTASCSDGRPRPADRRRPDGPRRRAPLRAAARAVHARVGAAVLRPAPRRRQPQLGCSNSTTKACSRSTWPCSPRRSSGRGRDCRSRPTWWIWSGPARRRWG